MALWQIVAQQETRDGRWSGSVQVPTFYVDAVVLSEVIKKALDVLWEGREAGVSGPVHLSLLQVEGDLSQVAGARVHSFTVLRQGDEIPEGARVMFKRVGASLQEVITEQRV